jgi:hypothetical protein
MRVTKAFPMIACLLWTLVSADCAKQQPKIILELFLVSPSADQTVAYGRQIAHLSRDAADPDTVARSLFAANCTAAILHSTSWRWEKDGTLVLTYIAFSEDPACGNVEPSRLSWNELLPPQTTDPQKPRPIEIRQEDVLAHGLRHITFLVRYSQDRRVAEALSPQSLKFFQSMCGQLAGRYETAREFEDCSKANKLQ